tara:strand:+ start:447 stop:2009 length:1563 start_codon:yes stop_codon:yes gene_type:complete
MFQSPLKTVSEKIKPVESKSSISSLKFERSSDFKKFIKFIKNETENLEKIKLPTTAEVEPKSKTGGVFGLLGIGLFGLLGSAFGGDGKDRFSIAGGTKSQFEKLDLVPVGGVANLRQAKAGQINLGESLKKVRKEKFQRPTSGEKKAGEKLKKKKLSKTYENIRQQKRIQRTKKKLARLEYEDLVKRSDEIQLKSKMKDFQKLQQTKRGRRLTKKFVTGFDDSIEKMINESPAQKLSRIAKEIQNVKDPKVKAQLQKQMDELFMSSAEMEQQMGKYTQEDFERAEELQKKGEEKLKKETELEKKYEEELKKERKKRIKKRYAFRGDPKLKINFDFFGKNVKFTPKDFLSGKFKQFGTATKPARDMFTKTISNIPGSKATFGMGKGLFKFLGKRYDIVTAGFEAYDLAKGFVVGDNILTAYYDLGVAIHNMFQPDKAKLMTYITNHQDSRLKVKKQEKNQKILQQINEAKKSQANNNQISAQEGSSGIVPFAKAVTSSPMGITMVPTIYSWKFVTEKLYKQ